MGFEPIDVGHPDANQVINIARARLDDSPPVWWYLSFVDPALAPPPEEQKPAGPSWLGACYVWAPNVVMAAAEAHRQGCNPGGEVAAWQISDEDMAAHVPLGDRNRLLKTQEDVL
jgi:hypothetical protein